MRSKQITIQKEYEERKRNPEARPKRPRSWARTSKKTIEKRNHNRDTTLQLFKTFIKIKRKETNYLD